MTYREKKLKALCEEVFQEISGEPATKRLKALAKEMLRLYPKARLTPRPPTCETVRPSVEISIPSIRDINSVADKYVAEWSKR